MILRVEVVQQRLHESSYEYFYYCIFFQYSFLWHLLHYGSFCPFLYSAGRVEFVSVILVTSWVSRVWTSVKDIGGPFPKVAATLYHLLAPRALVSVCS